MYNIYICIDTHFQKHFNLKKIYDIYKNFVYHQKVSLFYEKTGIAA